MKVKTATTTATVVGKLVKWAVIGLMVGGYVVAKAAKEGE